MSCLLLGCGNSRELILGSSKSSCKDKGCSKTLVTLDIDPLCNPDVVHDLNIISWPFENESFDEVHAYEVLEHFGSQGDYRSFFAHFYECWRILKPNGHLLASVPNNPDWIFGDPGHTRVITKGSLTFLNQEDYKKQVGVTPITDYRWLWKGNFQLVWESNKDRYWFVLRKGKGIE